MMMKQISIPPELCLEISLYLELRDVNKLALVCRDWNTALNSTNQLLVYQFQTFQSFVINELAKVRKGKQLYHKDITKIVFPPKYFQHLEFFRSNRKEFLNQVKYWRDTMQDPLFRRNKLARFFASFSHFAEKFFEGTESSLLVYYLVVCLYKVATGDIYDDNGEFVLKLITYIYIISLSAVSALSSSSVSLLTQLSNRLSIEETSYHSTVYHDQMYQWIGICYSGVILLKIANFFVFGWNLPLVPSWKCILVPWVFFWLYLCVRVYNISKGDKLSKKIQLLTYSVNLIMIAGGIVSVGVMKTLQKQYY
jgi:hypothetical protein